MGEVYRAHDPKLNRDVAIKILPEALAADPDALARFEREAQAVAALSHPNILAIFDFGRQADTVYAVMELLEGETLRARLGNGALPSRKAVELAAQIAEGLAAAHDKGIVHRDLKPENIFVTHDGRAKVLDFGLAKAVALGGATAPADPGASMQVTSGHTSAGMVLGTAAYMSPEQVRGEAVDHRSDIFAFGAVLYEMLTGRPAFGRETATESMTAILKEEPPEIAGADLSPGLQRIVEHCLEKKPGERFQSARDVAFALEALSGSATMSGPATVVSRPGWRRWLVAGGALAVAALLGVSGLALRRSGETAGRRSAAESVSFTEVSARPQAIFRAAFQPDGETIVYSAAIEGHVPDLYVIRPDHPEPEPLGLSRTHLLAISSTGEMAVLTSVRFIAQRVFTGTLARVSPGSTGRRQILESVHDADWSPDGSELAIIRDADGKDRLEYPIGRALYETAGYLSDLRVSPRGDRVALFEHPARWDDRGSLIVLDRAGHRTVLSGEYESEEGLAWSRSGD